MPTLTGLETPRQLAFMINSIEIDLNAELAAKEREKQELLGQINQCEQDDLKATLKKRLEHIEEEIVETAEMRFQYAK